MLALVVSYLVSESDLHRCVIIIAVLIYVIFGTSHVNVLCQSLVALILGIVLHLVLVESSLVDVTGVDVDGSLVALLHVLYLLNEVQWNRS